MFDFTREIDAYAANAKRTGYITGLLHACATAAAIIALILLMGCVTTNIDEHQSAPKGWPTLTITERTVGPIDMQRYCYKYVSLTMKILGGFAMACAEVNFAANTCTIYRVNDTDDYTMTHERQHCQGKSHYGETWAADALAAWNRGRK